MNQLVKDIDGVNIKRINKEMIDSIKVKIECHRVKINEQIKVQIDK